MKSMGSVSELDPKYFRTKNGQAIQGHFEVISGHCFAFQSEALFDPAFFQNQELLEFKSIWPDWIPRFLLVNMSQQIRGLQLFMNRISLEFADILGSLKSRNVS